MSEVAKLVPKPTAAEEDRLHVVKMLKEALAKAEAGEVDSALVILHHPDGFWRDERSGVRNFPEWIGRLEVIKQAWISGYLSEND